jgi:hypothetical protein
VWARLDECYREKLERSPAHSALGPLREVAPAQSSEKTESQVGTGIELMHPTRSAA